MNPQTGAVLANNQISPTYFTAAALALQKYLPAPTNDCGLVTYAIPSEQGENQFITRMDWTINQKQTLYGRYLLDGYQSPAFYSPTDILLTTQAGNTERVQASGEQRGTAAPHWRQRLRGGSYRPGGHAHEQVEFVLRHLFHRALQRQYLLVCR